MLLRHNVRGCLSLLLLSASLAGAQEVNVTARVVHVRGARTAKAQLEGEAVLWLVPLESQTSTSMPSLPRRHPQLVQKNKSFQPHLLVVPVGSLVDFPNRDPFFHNVFSLFEGKRFDLGLYEAGSSRQVLFDKPGVSYIFCDIHPEMSAVVLALATPYYGISDQHGQISIAQVPPGRYMFHIWDEAALPEQINHMTHEVEISAAAASLGVFRFSLNNASLAHKNKYGLDYDPPAPDNPAYPQP